MLGNLRRLIDNKPHIVLITIIWATLISALLHCFGIYKDLYVILSNVFGYSLAVNVILFLYYNDKNKRFCWFSKVTPIFLMAINIVNIAGYFFSYEYYELVFQIFISSICLILFIIHKFKSI